ncbi:phage tail fiber protein [Mesorhizobium sp. LNJC405B00]|uniref:phage tail fiber domain-containing protein n=1 Tax=Mesorhizobium sp. LNJC405B00 TaxID=1287281 RepID=UPI0003CE4118|nr:phage tail fiber protein [Mesorhizobium sp. LNJC405B00]ESX98622.1 hypothetical protein X755_15250 [Mesorhizobium sp. LNJC405B00]
MAYTPNLTAGNGSVTDFQVTFPYLRQAHVGVKVNGVVVSKTWVNAGMIRVSPAPGSGVSVEVYRDTPSVPLSTLQDNKPIPASTYNDLVKQTIYFAEEQAYLTAKGTAGDRVQTGLDRVAVAADRATVAADKATVAADKATVAADKGTVAADKASSGTNATNAANSATAAAASATSASNWEGLSYLYANQSEDVFVTGTTNYSAYHWARKALGYVTGGIASAIHGSTAKTTPVAADEFLILDSAATFGLRKIDWNALAVRIQQYVASATLAISGSLSATGNFTLGTANGTGQITANGGSIELAANRTADGVAYIDFHGAIGTDFDARIIRSAGANGGFLIQNLGTGDTAIYAGGNLALNGNAAGLYYNGVRVYTLTENDARYLQITNAKLQKAYDSGQQTITAGGLLTLAHGLGAKPPLYAAFIQCTTANAGYAVGDEIMVNPGLNTTDATVQAISIIPDATNLTVRLGNAFGSLKVMNKAGTGFSDITNTSWKLVVRAWA